MRDETQAVRRLYTSTQTSLTIIRIFLENSLDPGVKFDCVHQTQSSFAHVCLLNVAYDLQPGNGTGAYSGKCI